jgi:hypothetical protein
MWQHTRIGRKSQMEFFLKNISIEEGKRITFAL